MPDGSGNERRGSIGLMNPRDAPRESSNNSSQLRDAANSPARLTTSAPNLREAASIVVQQLQAQQLESPPSADLTLSQKKKKTPWTLKGLFSRTGISYFPSSCRVPCFIVLLTAIYLSSLDETDNKKDKDKDKDKDKEKDKELPAPEENNSPRPLSPPPGGWDKKEKAAARTLSPENISRGTSPARADGSRDNSAAVSGNSSLKSFWDRFRRPKGTSRGAASSFYLIRSRACFCVFACAEGAAPTRSASASVGGDEDPMAEFEPLTTLLMTSPNFFVSYALGVSVPVTEVDVCSLLLFI